MVQLCHVETSKVWKSDPDIRTLRFKNNSDEIKQTDYDATTTTQASLGNKQSKYITQMNNYTKCNIQYINRIRDTITPNITRGIKIDIDKHPSTLIYENGRFNLETPFDASINVIQHLSIL